MWIVYALLAALTAAIVVVATKAGLEQVAPATALAIQGVFILVISWSLVLFGGHFAKLAEIDRRAWIFLIVAGVATTLSSFFSYKALSLGNASWVTSVERLSIVIALILSVTFLKEKLSWQLVTGAAIMIVGAVMIAMAGKG
ncbi:EamA family transporter [Hufsiella ginkgonis]|uniref:EamA family transporter n=1 Tax=Hufsiella ginkgonis TaxID=2695274 RepID=A0A7K1XXP1_9SPHI|nr:EamA family transporter [Hufsiella ginkgonis]MXV15774.1 EamA family transporter [Hufsiella ginkgonis]